jgi:hypothetical protein
MRRIQGLEIGAGRAGKRRAKDRRGIAPASIKFSVQTPFTCLVRDRRRFRAAAVSRTELINRRLPSGWC